MHRTFSWSVYRVPEGMPGADNFPLVYHAQIPTVTTQSFYWVRAGFIDR